jgi:hypothetical protein
MYLYFLDMPHIFDHLLYSPDLTPSDFHLFLHLKKHLAGTKFDDGDEVQAEVMTWFKGWRQTSMTRGDTEAGSKT